MGLIRIESAVSSTGTVSNTPSSPGVFPSPMCATNAAMLRSGSALYCSNTRTGSFHPRIASLRVRGADTAICCASAGVVFCGVSVFSVVFSGTGASDVLSLSSTLCGVFAWGVCVRESGESAVLTAVSPGEFCSEFSSSGDALLYICVCPVFAVGESSSGECILRVFSIVCKIPVLFVLFVLLCARYFSRVSSNLSAFAASLIPPRVRERRWTKDRRGG